MEEKILLAHGSGGKLSHDLIREVFLPAFDNPILRPLEDGAQITMSGMRLALTTDSYVVKPLFYKGGDIGRLAVFGTVNDLSMCGASPLFLSASFVIEEGFSINILKRIVQSMREASEEAGVMIVTGDTKVVDRGSADQIFINTTGVGLIEEGVHFSSSNVRPGDRVILSGFIGDHGISVMTEREELGFHEKVASDCAPLNRLVGRMLQSSSSIRCLRDPTRGGLATTLNEIAQQSNVGVHIEEASIPIQESVRGVCEMLGFDPLYVANEGKLVAFIEAEAADRILRVMREDKMGIHSAIIGQVNSEPKGKVILKTRIGGSRILDMPTGDLLPRIC
jgi:hydrogenase expression/formation protein HypE